MSDMAPDRIPSLTLGWRLKMALGKMNTQVMADALEVSRATVSRWMADHGAPPRKVYVRQWALMTGTDVGWLLTGQASPSSTPASPATRLTRERDARVLNLVPCPVSSLAPAA